MDPKTKASKRELTVSILNEANSLGLSGGSICDPATEGEPDVEQADVREAAILQDRFVLFGREDRQLRFYGSARVRYSLRIDPRRNRKADVSR